MCMAKEYIKNCVLCKNDFHTNIQNKKFCNDSCRKKNELIKTGRAVTDGYKLSGNMVGAISELHIINDLLKKGFAVFRQISMSNMFDIVAIRDHETYFIEARTGYISDAGKITYPPKIHPKANLFGICIRNGWEVKYLSKDGNEVFIV
jgi:hypothetical protein